MGDFMSANFDLDRLPGPIAMASVFAAILLAERRLRTGSEAFYWLAAVTVFSAATGLGDMLKHGRPWYVALGSLTMALAIVQAAEKRFVPRHPGELVTGIPNTDPFYWAALLVAGAMGTVVGDFVAEDIGLGVGLGSLALGILLALALIARSMLGAIGRVPYWGTVAIVRCLATTTGDFFAGREGLHWTLPASIAFWAIALFAVLRVLPPPKRQEATGG